MDMPKPTPGHAKLQQLAGNWEGEERMYPSQWDPKGGTAVARMKSRLSLNGFVLISDYEQERDGTVTFSGHSVFSFNPADGFYTLHWFDCMGSPAEIFLGRFDGDVLTLSHGGPGMHARMTYDLSNSAHMLSRMEMSKDGKTWMTLFDGRYERVSP
jgi:uncharacterized protein YodC (DUF2158 family)